MDVHVIFAQQNRKYFFFLFILLLNLFCSKKNTFFFTFAFDFLVSEVTDSIWYIHRRWLLVSFFCCCCYSISPASGIEWFHRIRCDEFLHQKIFSKIDEYQADIIIIIDTIRYDNSSKYSFGLTVGYHLLRPVLVCRRIYAK